MGLCCRGGGPRRPDASRPFVGHLRCSGAVPPARPPPASTGCRLASSTPRTATSCAVCAAPCKARSTGSGRLLGPRSCKARCSSDARRRFVARNAPRYGRAPPGRRSGRPLHMGRGGRQGAPWTPALWNQYFAGCLQDCHAAWAERGDRSVPLFGRQRQRQRRLADVQTTFATRGLALSDSSLEVLRNPEADTAPLSPPATG